MRIELKHKELPREVPLVVFFVRHGQAENNDGTKPLGPPLTDLGERQAERVARRLSEDQFDHVYSSDLARAWQTAQFILKYQHHLGSTVTSDLREVSHFHFAPGPIPLTLGQKKTLREERVSMERFVAMIRQTHIPGERVLVVCHGNIIRSMVPLLASRRPEKSVMMDINNTAVTVLDVWPSGEGVLRLANCTKHLVNKQVT